MFVDQVKDKIKDLPDSTGVYEFFDAEGKIIYAGKARNLKKRVMSYFQAGRARNSRLELLANETRDIKFIRTSSEAEALIYEAGIIKSYAPKFNVELKDDKSYPFLKLTVNEEYPRLFITRRKFNDGAVYYGPYTDVKMLKEAVSSMKKFFPLRTCRVFKKKACLEYHILQCKCPCEKKVTLEEYKEIVDQLKKFLEGKRAEILEDLRTKMNRFAREREYEKALQIKKRIEMLTSVRKFHNQSIYPIYGELEELQKTLRLCSLPEVIECFDISDITGKCAAGAMVKFVNGAASKTEYRKFCIKGTQAINDYVMIREVVRRRYLRLIEEKKKFPDLVLIDGGKGHLACARKELNDLGLVNVAAASIAKEHNHIYIVSRAAPIRLSPGSRVLLLIQRIRDEAHRFAISYHRKLRTKECFK